jgi:predicted Fe-Mo cluster-binding NifX family protein
MRVAFASWEGRIASVFDTARQVRLVDCAAGGIAAQSEVALADDLPVRRVLHLVELDVDTLVCGAISRSLHDQVAAYGIAVFPFVAGDLDEVVQAWLAGELSRDAFAMPGCCGRRRLRHRQGRKRRCQAETEPDPWDRGR